MTAIRLGIACPMANEGRTATSFVRDVLAATQQFGFASVFFCAVLDNASSDDTLDQLEELSANDGRVRVIWAPENRTVVDAYLRGYREALAIGSDWILEIDAGYSHDPAQIPQFLEAMQTGADCVFGTRLARGGSMTNTPLTRRLVGRGGTILSNAMLGTKLSDMTSGFELFRAPVLRRVLDIGVSSRGPFFQTEIKAMCRYLRVVEIPITYSTQGTLGSDALKDSFVQLARLTRARLRRALPAIHPEEIR